LNLAKAPNSVAKITTKIPRLELVNGYLVELFI